MFLGRSPEIPLKDPPVLIGRATSPKGCCFPDKFGLVFLTDFGDTKTETISGVDPGIIRCFGVVAIKYCMFSFDDGK